MVMVQNVQCGASCSVIVIAVLYMAIISVCCNRALISDFALNMLGLFCWVIKSEVSQMRTGV